MLWTGKNQLKTQIFAQGSNPEEQIILDLLQTGIADGDILIGKSGLPISKFNQTITMLEITGKIRMHGGNQWGLF